MKKIKWYDACCSSNAELMFLVYEWENVNFDCKLPKRFLKIFDKFYYYIEGIRQHLLSEGFQPDFTKLKEIRENHMTLIKTLLESGVPFPEAYEESIKDFRNWMEKKHKEVALMNLTKFIMNFRIKIGEDEYVALLHLLYLGMDLEILNGKNDVEKRVSEEISKRMSESASQRNKEFRDHYKQKQKEAFDKNPNLTANSFALSFCENPTMEIPYVKTNQLNQLIKLAQENNKEFKKAKASIG